MSVVSLILSVRVLSDSSKGSWNFQESLDLLKQSVSFLEAKTKPSFWTTSYNIASTPLNVMEHYSPASTVLTATSNHRFDVHYCFHAVLDLWRSCYVLQLIWRPREVCRSSVMIVQEVDDPCAPQHPLTCSIIISATTHHGWTAVFPNSFLLCFNPDCGIFIRLKVQEWTSCIGASQKHSESRELSAWQQTPEDLVESITPQLGAWMCECFR